MTILQTERLLLRPLAPTDFAAFRTFAADGELTKANGPLTDMTLRLSKRR